MDDDTKLFFARSRLRAKVLKKVSTTPQIASFLATELKTYREVISRVFAALEERGFIKCSNPKAQSYRYYKITNEGRSALRALKRIGLLDILLKHKRTDSMA